MYEDHFRLKRKPFSIAPDPGFLFMSERHREALAHLMYGLQTDGGFVLVTGEVGTGKTTLIRSLVDRIPENLDVAFILNPRLTAQELLETLCEELGIAEQAAESRTVKHYVDRLTKHLLRTHAMGRSTVMIIDEAQNLSPAVLEQIRLLTNLETNEKKLLRIILLGQPELAELLDRREMRQLSQRITARYHLGALDPQETRAYIAHRLSLAGGNANLFTAGACRAAYSATKGIPRLINVLCDRAMLGAYVEGTQRVSAGILRRAGREVSGQRRNAPRIWLAAGLMAAAVGGAWAYLAQTPSPADAPPRASSEATPPVEPGATGERVADAPKSREPAPPSTAVDPVIASSAPTEVAVPAAEPADIVEEPTIITPMTAAIEAAKRAPREPVALVRPPDQTAYQTQRSAYDVLFKAWGQSIDDIDIPCNQAPKAGLQCLKQNGGWDELVRTDRPAVLELWDERPEPYYAAATSIKGDEVALTVGDDVITTTRETLTGRWYGNFVVLWRMPPYYQGSVKRGDRSATVAWLRDNLARATAIAETDAPRDLFDAQLHDAVIRFQRESGLIPDGIAGPATWIALSSAIAEDAPRLRGG